MADVMQDTAAAPHAAPSGTEKQAPRSSPESTDTDLNMDQGAAAKSDSDTGGAGLVSNTALLTEEEAEQMLAPEDLCREEERLRQEREQAAAAEAAEAAKAAETVLSQQRFAQLDALLNKAGMYTQFLTEQMQSFAADTPGAGSQGEEEEADEEEGDEEEAGKGKGKRKKGRKTPASKKRQKTSMAAVAARGAAAAAAAAKAHAAAGSLAEKQKSLIPLIEGELRDYQLAGVTWMISLYSNGLNGILADQMGLGKTVQTIAFLSHLRSRGVNGPFLIIGPLSTLRNWSGEVKRWCPSMPVLEYHGSGAKARAALRAQHMPCGATVGPDFPVVVSTYEIVMADIKALGRYNWKYIVVDEGHRLKNFNCKLIRDLKTLPAENKMLLTGTPLQNNLSELWSLLNFLMPDIFANLSDFQGWFDFSTVGSQTADQTIMAAEQRDKVVSKLHQLLKPFMLRRMKADVEIFLPRKQEILLYAPMSEEQQKINKQLLDKTLGDEMAKLAASEGISTSGLSRINNVLMQMRKNCNHPDLITSAFTADLQGPPLDTLLEQSGKLALLDRMLKKLKARGHKVLIFSQMTRMLDLLEDYIEQTGHRACRLDGSIPYQQRQEAIESFNSDPNTWLFLLSTRAGGLGINLTAADTVIIYDSDWNPCADLQAMDRCHRIGQQRPVLVFRLATSHSVEGKMLRRACDKMALERLVIKKGVFKEVLDMGAAQQGGGQTSSKAGGASSMSAAELLSLLRADFSMEDVPQSGVVDDDMLDRLLDRSWMLEEEEAQEEKGDDSAAAAAAAGPSSSKAAAGSSKGRGRLSRSSSGAAAADSAQEEGAATKQGSLPYPKSGVGYEVVQSLETNVLSNVNGGDS